MTKRQHMLVNTTVLVLGFVFGVGTTVYGMGAYQQRLKDDITQLSSDIVLLKQADIAQADTIANAMSNLRDSITALTNMANQLHSDVEVLKALVDRIENQIDN